MPSSYQRIAFLVAVGTFGTLGCVSEEDGGAGEGGAAGASGATAGGSTSATTGTTGGTTSATTGTTGTTGGTTSATTGTTGTAGTGTTGTATICTEPAAQVGMTAAHNAVRASVSPSASPALSPLVWACDLAAVAQAYAAKCQYGHSNGSYGENIYAVTGGTVNPQEVVDYWASEVAAYDYGTNGCSDDCGHYTQIVWRDTARVGCGMAICNTGSPWGSGTWQFYVCNYDPPGNYEQEKPY